MLLGSISVSFDKWLPYASGCLIAHSLKSHPDVEFLEPIYKAIPLDEFKKRISNVDVLGLTVYTWNQALCEIYSKLYKEMNPQGFIVWGGPNIPKSKTTFATYKKKYPYVNLFQVGMGEVFFCSLLKDLKAKKVTNSYLNTNTPTKSLLPSVNEVTNPYIEGVFDTILKNDNNLKASFETNRGCPYQCSFCDWGGQSNSKIEKIDRDVIDKTIDYLFSFSSIKEIEILDANFGLFEEDLFTIQKMVKAKKKYGTSPNISYSGLAKNGSKFLPEILKILSKEFNINTRHFKLSFQSHSLTTLETNLRKNIKNEKLLSVIEHLPEATLSSELIIGLPGDTPQAFSQTLSKDIEIGIDQSRAYILSATENTTLKTEAFVKKHGLKFKTINFPIEFSKLKRNVLLNEQEDTFISGQELFEQHHIVYQCNSYKLQDLKKIYTYWWFHHNFYNAQTIAGLIKQLHNEQYYYSDWLDSFINYSRSKKLLSNQLTKVDHFVDTYFSPEQETTITSYPSYLFASGAMRTNELALFIKYQEDLKGHLKDFFTHDRFPTPNADISCYLEEDMAKWKEYSKSDDLSSLIGLNATVALKAKT